MSFETVLVRVCLDVIGDVWQNYFSIILANGESREMGL